jgi:hypothetical protein
MYTMYVLYDQSLQETTQVYNTLLYFSDIFIIIYNPNISDA